MLLGAEGLLEVGERLGLVAKRDAENDDLGFGEGIGVLGPAERPLGNALPGSPDGFMCALRVTRADDDGDTGAPQPHRKPEAKRPGPPDDADGAGHGPGVYDPWTRPGVRQALAAS